MPPERSEIELPERFDVALSFAGPQRHLAERIATIVREAGFEVFYDNFYTDVLWGKDLVELFGEIYRKKARHCVMVISRDYAERMWTILERRSALARALEERGNEYILPVKVEDVELPGLLPTIAYVSVEQYIVEQIADILIRKLRRHPVQLSIAATAAPVSIGPNFAREFGEQWNARIYVGLFVGAVPEGADELEEPVLDAVEEWLQTIEPTARAFRTTPQIGWWRVPAEDSSFDEWSCRLLSGPVLAIRRHTAVTEHDDGASIWFPAVVAEWVQLVSTLPSLLEDLHIETIVVGLTLNTVLVDPTTISIVDVDFEAAPRPRKSGERQGVPSWSYKTPVIPASDVSPQIIRTAAEGLLRHFSYRGLDALLEWVERSTSVSASRYSDIQRAVLLIAGQMDAEQRSVVRPSLIGPRLQEQGVSPNEAGRTLRDLAGLGVLKEIQFHGADESGFILTAWGRDEYQAEKT